MATHFENKFTYFDFFFQITTLTLIDYFQSSFETHCHTFFHTPTEEFNVYHQRDSFEKPLEKISI